MPTIEDAILWATEVHRGQVDKAGHPYILHPLRVMLRMTSDDARFVAILHDTIEDSDHTLDDLRALGYSETIIAAVDAITRRADETYEQFIQRLKPNPLARKVKLADLLDNHGSAARESGRRGEGCRTPRPLPTRLDRTDTRRSAAAVLVLDRRLQISRNTEILVQACADSAYDQSDFVA